jgi:hypothetical protein
MAHPVSLFGKLAHRLSRQEFSVFDGAKFVVAFALLGFWMPAVLFVLPEFLLGGLFAGYVVGSTIEGVLSTVLGGSLAVLLWAVALAIAGDLAGAVTVAVLGFGNVVAGGALGGAVASRVA